MIAPWVRARFDRDQAITSLAVGEHAAAPREVRIERCVVLVVLVEVAPRRVRLPYLDQRVAHRTCVVIAHGPRHDDPLAEWRAGVLVREIGVGVSDGPMAEHGA